MNQIKAFLKNEEGAETLEYVVIVAVIAIPAVVAYGAGLPDVLDGVFDEIADTLNRCFFG
ncbi:MAG: Flp family type IVb pilin [Methylococcales bacterium]